MYQELVDLYREAPVLSDTEEKAKKPKKEASPPKKAAKPAKKAKDSDDSSSGSDSDEKSGSSDGSSSDESSSEEESEEEDKGGDKKLQAILKADPSTLTMAERRLRWVKKEFLPWNINKDGDAGKSDKKLTEEEIEELKRKKLEAENREFGETDLRLNEDFQIDFTKKDKVLDKLREIRADQKKGKANSHYQVKILEFMESMNTDPRLQAEVKIQIITAYLEAASVNLFMTCSEWEAADRNINDIIDCVQDADKKKKINAPYDIANFGDNYDFRVTNVEKTLVPLLVS
jgi:hypothetical protein